MLAIDECRRYLEDELTDDQVDELRAVLYELVDVLIDDYIAESL